MKNGEVKGLPQGVTVHEKAAMSAFTTFQLGGPCSALIECPNAALLVETVQSLQQSGADYLVIGQGSNLLISDAGLDCIVLRYCAEEMTEIERDGNRLTVPGNMLLDDLARRAIDIGLGDLSFCCGIPGTVGGAIAGNAGAFGKQMGDMIDSVRLLSPAGEIRTVAANKLHFAYRSSVLKETGEIILSALLKLTPMNIDEMNAERDRIMQLRRSKHPDWRSTPCAGSIFRNIEPTSAAERRKAAGWFLEEVGAKDFRVGGARLFDKHANIIVAEPNATAQDVFELTEKMIAAVEKRFGFTLVRELRMLGKF